MNRNWAAIFNPKQPAALVFWQQIAVFLLACAVVISRRPDAVFHAQFYAEDGHVWFADAYNLGWWHALFRAQDGYFQTFPRLGAALALLVPMARAPLVMNILAIAAQALPVSLLLSARSQAWGSLRFRAVLAAAYLALPDSSEIGFGITESQWLLASSAFLVLAAAAASTRPARIFDVILLLLCGLTGPFCVVLLPIAMYLAWRRGGRSRWTYASLLAACALVQAYALLVVDRLGRPYFALGANWERLTRIVSGNIVLGAALGRTGLAAMPGSAVFVFLLCAAIAGSVIAAFCFFKADIEMKLLFILTGMLFLASLLVPNAHPPAGSNIYVWDLLIDGCGARYWFFPSLVFMWSLLWCARSGGTALRIGAAAFLFVMCFTIPLSWRQPAYKELQFAAFARNFASMPPGTAMVIPENPDGWEIRLVKRSSH